jgi:hypothetical protein
VWALLLVVQDLLVGRDGGTTVKDTGSDICHELGETSELVTDLVGKFSGVAQNDNRDFSVDGFTGDASAWWLVHVCGLRLHSHLLQRGQDEHCRLTHTRLCLTQHIGTEDGLGNALLLN